MATKKKANAKAPASKKPAAKRLVDAATEDAMPVRKPGGKKAGLPVRAAMKKVNKAVHEENRASAVSIAGDLMGQGQALGRAVVGRPDSAPVARYWRKPEVEWSDAIEEDLFILMSTGHGMNAIANIEGMPSVYQMMRWFADKNHAFTRCRARAQENLVPFYEELAKDIAMTANKHAIVTERQALTRDGDVEDLVETRWVDNVERSKLAVSTLQWTLSHLQPKKHGRAPDAGGDKPNAQLEGLFAALKAGPVK